MANKMASLLKSNIKKHHPVERGELLQGEVVRNDGRNILVDIGGKSEGVLSRREISEENIDISQFKVGSKIPVVVNQSETDQGFTILSFKKAAVRKEWQNINKALKEGDVLEAAVTDINSGGMVVTFGNLSGFVPVSHLNQNLFTLVREYLSGDPALRGQKKQELVGKKIKVKIIEIDKQKDRLIASQRKALDEKDQKKQKEALKKIKAGDILEGKVTNVTPFGIFVNVGEIEGLAHVSELSWEHIAHPAQIFSVGDKVKVKVLESKPDEGKLSLSTKALIENPFSKFAQKHKVGSKVKGKVVKIVPYGIFINLSSGVDGFMHVSEIEKPSKVGDTIETVVTEVNISKKRISLSAKQVSKK